VECAICGSYRITSEAVGIVERDPALAAKLAGWVHENTRMGVEPLIKQDTLDWIATYQLPNTKRRAELYLGAVIEKLQGALIGRFPISDPALRVASWSRSNEDCLALANYLEKLGAIEDVNNTQEKRLVAEGHIIFEEISAKRALSTQVFVAMSFHADLTSLFENGIALAIRGAGYEPLRVDRTDYDGKIDDEIIAQIRRSAFVVTDFTQHRGGVYYEAGFAHGLGRRVIFTCRNDDLANLHFDVRQYNTIEWTTPASIVKPLQNRILALFGAGPLIPDAKPII